MSAANPYLESEGVAGSSHPRNPYLDDDGATASPSPGGEGRGEGGLNPYFDTAPDPGLAPPVLSPGRWDAAGGRNEYELNPAWDTARFLPRRNLGDVLTQPLVDLPRLNSGIPAPVLAAASPGAKLAIGAGNAVIGAAEFIETPLGVAALASGGLPAIAQRLIAAGFAIDMARHTPAQLRALDAALASGDPQAIGETATALGLTTTFTAGAAGHAILPKGGPALDLARTLDRTREGQVLPDLPPPAPLTARPFDATKPFERVEPSRFPRSDEGQVTSQERNPYLEETPPNSSPATRPSSLPEEPPRMESPVPMEGQPIESEAAQPLIPAETIKGTPELPTPNSELRSEAPTISAPTPPPAAPPAPAPAETAGRLETVRSDLAALKEERRQLREAVGGNLNNASGNTMLGGLSPTKIRHANLTGEIRRLEAELRTLRGMPAPLRVVPKTKGNSINQPKGNGLLLDVYDGPNKIGEIGRDNFGKLYAVHNGELISDSFRTVAEAKAALRNPRSSPVTGPSSLPPETPPAAAAKVQEHVTATARTEGVRPAKEIKSELVERIEAELGRIPEMPEAHFSKPASYNGKKKFSASIPGHSVEVRESSGSKWQIVDYISRKNLKSPTGEERNEVVLNTSGQYADLAAAKRLAMRELELKAFPERQGTTTTIDIPGDGTFTLQLTRHALEEMLRKAKTIETGSTPPKGFTESVPTKAQSEMWAGEAAVDEAAGYYVHEGVSKEWKKVPGRRVELKGLPGQEFFLHRPIEPGASGWIVSEARTGMRVGSGATEKAAIAAAEAAVQKFGIETTVAAIENTVKAGKVSPRFNPSPPPESINTGALGPLGMGGAKPGEFAGGQQSPTSIKNAQVDVERQRRGLPPAMQPAARSFDTVWDEAMARLDRDPGASDRLVAELTDKPRALTDLEDALLLHRQIDLQNEYGRVTRDLANAYDDAKAFPNRLADVEDLKAQAATLSDRLLALYDLNKRVGTESGRGLNARKMMAFEDFTLASMEVEKRAANEGRPLTHDERAEVQRLQEKIATQQQAFDDYVAQAEAAKAQRASEEALRTMRDEAAREPVHPPEVQGLADRIVARLETEAASARARLRARLSRTSAGIDPGILYDLSVIGASHIARGVLDSSRFGAKLIEEFGEGVRDYLEAAWTAANAKIDAEVTRTAGTKAPAVRQAVRRNDPTQQRERILAGLTEAHANGRPLAELGDYVRKLALNFVRSGVNTREALIDAVHAELVKLVPDITRRQAMDAISGYGEFRALDPNAIKAQLRDLKGQMQQLAKLEDIQARQPALKTGVERRTPSDTERRLIQQVNDAKRRFGVVSVDPARQLKGALDSIKTRLQNQIADYEFQLSTHEKIVRTKAPTPFDAESKLLEARRDELRRDFDTMFPREGLSDAKRAELAERAITRQIEDYERRIAAGDLAGRARRFGPETAQQAALKARRTALQAELEALRAAAVSPEAALADYKARLLTRTAEYQDRLARGDFAPPQRRELVLDNTALRLKAQLEIAKEHWRRGLELDRLRTRSLPHRFLGGLREALNLPRAVLSSWDVSAVLRQGGFITLAHPLRALSSLGPMFRALASRERAAMVEQEIQHRPNAVAYHRAKLYLAPLETTRLSSMEEAFMSRLASRIPGVKHSERAYVTFLNKLRADSFDALLDKLQAKGTPLNDAELGAIANFINVATGRGDMGRAAASAETLATVFFSPRLFTSRFQLLAGQPLYRGSARTRTAIAQEYARFLGGFALISGLAALAGAQLEGDPRSADFGKLRFGNTRVDLLAGLSQATVLLSRLTSGQTRNAAGELKSLRGAIPFGGADSAGVMGRFLRSKLAPVPASLVDAASGRNVVGQPVTPASAAGRLLVPLTFGDIYGAMKEQGIPAGTALGVLAAFGAGLQVQPDPAHNVLAGEAMKRVRGGTPAQREALRQQLLESMKP